jgi:hypothetical protein
MQIASRLIGNDLVSVQPLSLPTGKLFYMDFIYDDEKRKLKRKIELRKKKIKRVFRIVKLRHIIKKYIKT